MAVREQASNLWEFCSLISVFKTVEFFKVFLVLLIALELLYMIRLKFYIFI